MSLKAWVTFGVIIGSTIGGYIPTFWNESFLSLVSVFGSFAGGLIGIWLGFKLYRFFS